MLLTITDQSHADRPSLTFEASTITAVTGGHVITGARPFGTTELAPDCAPSIGEVHGIIAATHEIFLSSDWKVSRHV